MAARRLGPEEAALWQRVTGSVRRLSGVAPAAVLPPGPSVAAPSGSAHLMPPVRAKPLPVADRSRAAIGHTLDGSWDKRISTGQISPDRTIDLHGHTLSGAHHRLDIGIDDAIRDGARVILLITGHAARRGASRIDLPLRGIIRESVGDWIAASRHVRSIAAVRNAHPRHGGAGALYIILRRPR